MTYRIYGSELSPYSVKVRSFFRYKNLDHEWIPRSPAVQAEFQKYAKLPLVPLVVTPEGEGIQDSTPILERFEASHPEPSVTPADPALAFVSALLEEYGDEWGNKWMFHYRWRYQPDVWSTAERIAQQMHRIAEHGGAGSGESGELGIVRETAVPHRQLGVGRVVPRGVDRFEHAHRVDPIADAGGHDPEQVGKTGVHARAEDGAASARTGLDDARPSVAEGVPGDEPCGGDHVDPRLEDPHHVIDVGPLRVVDHAIGFESEQRVDVIGGEHPDGIDPAQFAHITTDLVGAPRVATDELESRVRDRSSHRSLAHVPGRPLHDSVGPRHGHPPRSGARPVTRQGAGTEP